MKLHYIKDTDLIWKRVKKGSGFSFVNREGHLVPAEDHQRLVDLAIPPAWEEVVVVPDPLAHIQAIGKDARGRRQYIYHPDLVKHNQTHKYNSLVAFGEALPPLREAVRGHMREHRLTHDRVVATVVWLLEHTFIRVGNRVYADENQSYGLTTLHDKHVEVSGDRVRFSFMGKSGVYHELGITHPRVAKTIRACIDLPGYQLFQYLDENNQRRSVDSEDVNNYLQTYAGADFSAKDFRTWGGSVLAGESFYNRGNPKTDEEAKQTTSEVVAIVSKHLGNSQAICRTYYIHPRIIKSYEEHVLVPHFAETYQRRSHKLDLPQREYATWTLIKGS